MAKTFVSEMRRNFFGSLAGSLEAQGVDGSVIGIVGSVLCGESESGSGILDRLGDVAAGTVSCSPTDATGAIINTYPFGQKTDQVYDVFLGISRKPKYSLQKLFKKAAAYCRAFEKRQAFKSAYETGVWSHVILITDTWDPDIFAKFEHLFLYHAVRYGICFTILLCTDYGLTLVPFLPQRDFGKRVLKDLKDSFDREGWEIAGIPLADPQGEDPDPVSTPVLIHQEPGFPDMRMPQVQVSGSGTQRTLTDDDERRKDFKERLKERFPIITYVSNIGTYASEEWVFDLSTKEWSVRSVVSERRGTIPTQRMNKLLDELSAIYPYSGRDIIAPDCTAGTAAYQLRFADRFIGWIVNSRDFGSGDGFFVKLREKLDSLTEGCLKKTVYTKNFPIS